MLFLFAPKKFKTKEKIDLQNVIDFYVFTQTNLNIWTTTSDCPSKVDYRNESLAVEVVEAVECPVSKLCLEKLKELPQACKLYNHTPKV